jgi:hypothetical protein
MKTINLVIIGAVALSFASAIPSFAIEGLKISVQSSNVVLSWPSTNGETYIVQYRPTLNTTSSWTTLTDFYAYCEIEWSNPESAKEGEAFNEYRIIFDLDLQNKQLVGMSLYLSNTNCARPLPKIDVMPELESDYGRGSHAEPTNGMNGKSTGIQTNSASP